MKKLLTFVAALGMFSGVYAKKVKFQVDMTGQQVSGSGVHVAGNFQGWSPNTTRLNQEGTSSIYSIIADVDSMAVIEFKFINGDFWGAAEGVPALSQKGHPNNGETNDNRWFFSGMGSDTMVLPAFLFGQSNAAGKVAVRLAVDFAKVSSPGWAYVAGAFQGWNSMGNPMANLYSSNKLFETILQLDSGNYGYKFINKTLAGDSWEDVPSACNVGGNRELVVGSTNFNVSKVCFAACEACPTAPIPTFSITFRVDMANTDCDGAIDSVTIAGGKIPGAWGDGTKLSNGGSGTVYSVTLSLDSGEVEFKYRWHKNGNTNWEGIANRKVMLTADTTLAINCFNTNASCEPKPATSTINFYADLEDVTPADTVWIIGSFTRPNWQGGKIALTPVSGYPFLYSASVQVCDGSFAYKFVNGSVDNVNNEEFNGDATGKPCNESNGIGGFNRTFTRTTAEPVNISYKFNTCDTGRIPTATGVKEVSALNNIKIYPNPATTDITIALNGNENYTINIMDVTGKSVYSINTLKVADITINKGDIGNGIFFVNITNNAGINKTIKLIVQ